MSNFDQFLDKIIELGKTFKTKVRAESLSNIYTQIVYALDSYDEWIVDIYRDTGGSFFVITTNKGKLFQYPVSFDVGEVNIGEAVLVEVQFVERQSFELFRAKGERTRWVSVSCTSVINKDGEIDSTKLFDSIVDHVERSGDYPYRTFWHKGEQFRTGQCDFIAREENVLITSGLYDDSELARREIKAREEDPDFWADSIQYETNTEPEILQVTEDISIPVYNKGRMIEVSTVAAIAASSFFVTNKTSLLEEVRRVMKDNQREAFNKLFGTEEEADSWLEENVDEVNREIDESDAIRRDADTDEEEITEEVVAEDSEDVEDEEIEDVVEETTDEEEDGEETVQEIELDEATIRAISEQAVPHILGEVTPQLEAMQKTMDEFLVNMRESQAAAIHAQKANASRFEALERSKDDEVEALVKDLPRNTRIRAAFRPKEQTSDNEVEEQQSYEEVANATLANIV